MKSAKRSQSVTRYRGVTTPTVTPSNLSDTQETPNVTALPLVNRTPPSIQTLGVGGVADLDHSLLFDSAITPPNSANAQNSRQEQTANTLPNSANALRSYSVTKPSSEQVGATLTALPELLTATREAIRNNQLPQAGRILGNRLLRTLNNPETSHESQQAAIQCLYELMEGV